MVIAMSAKIMRLNFIELWTIREALEIERLARDGELAPMSDLEIKIGGEMGRQYVRGN